jgi:hypothetical protein
MVYVLRQSHGRKSYLKIGHSTNIAKRIKSHQSSSPVPLEIITIKEGMKKEETDIHRDLHGFRLEGEWFEDSPEVFKYLGIRDPKNFKQSRRQDPGRNRLSAYFYSNTHAAYRVDELFNWLGFNPEFWEPYELCGYCFETNVLSMDEIENRKFVGTPFNGKVPIIQAHKYNEKVVQVAVELPLYWMGEQ